jgi:ABC-2 type transport system ATP-binding protein
MLEVQKVTKDFGQIRAVDNLGFRVETGDIYGLLGPNGAGKTTTIRMIMQIIQPDAGSITLNGEPVTVKKKDHIGYLPEERGLYQKMKIRDVIMYLASLKNMSQAKARENTERYRDRFDLLGRAEDKIEELSRGNQQKIQFILSVIHEPELLILDEPFSGLDPVNQVLLKTIINEFRERGTTVLLSTHQMEQVEKLCERICLIHEGRSVLDGNLKEIKRQYGTKSIRVVSDDPMDDLLQSDAFVQADVEDGALIGELREEVEPGEYLRTLAANYNIRAFEVVEPSLEQIFIDQVGGVKK